MRQSDPTEILSPRYIGALIAEGNSIIIVDQKVLRLDAWIPYHPGGHKTIQHVVGKDATDEFTVFHSDNTRASIHRYQIGRIEGRWENVIPPIQGGIYRRLDDSETCPQPTMEQALKDHPEPEQDEDEITFIDAQTKQEIQLTRSTYPAVDSATQDHIIQRYRELHEQIQTEGLYNCNYIAYAWEFARCVALLSAMLIALRWGWYTTSAICLGMFWSQMVFAAHDAGHMGITHNYTIDTLIGMTIAAPIGGLSLGWWKRTHNVHHIITNAPEHDPDNQHLPVFAVNHRFFTSLPSTYHERTMPYNNLARALVPYQAGLYYIILLFGRFNLYIQSWLFLFHAQGPRKGPAKWHRWYEVLGNIIFWLWFGYGLLYRSLPTPGTRITYLLISHMVTMPLHVQFTLSHFAMSTADLGPLESFAQRMLRTTMDVDCPEWLDWFHGGLQFQAVHHLFPRVPRHNLRRAQRLVIGFCRDVGIPYALYGFVGGNCKVVGSLAEVGRQAAVLEKCRGRVTRDVFTREFTSRK
ncbi:fatty acid desaturase-domain-containing protein [Aspergillus avenaceus]|uniref:Delta 8-(E)-sphingolipid desaturase n=1 Tax=Aspergillus avenaceus TaxID=36643 RepID=A0A5N6TZP3_ASPAV|nr:fatty acid desaturase-domain-containing protein [Aspergillus avenaceus]